MLIKLDNPEGFTKAMKFFIIMIVISVIAVAFTFIYAIDLSSFAVGIAKFTIALLVVWAFDRFACREVNTMEELKKGNVAYALFLLGVLILAAAVVAQS